MALRKFETGATRDGADDKYDYEAFLSPLVLEKFAEYMHRHRFLADGTVRDGDDWQKGFGDKHYDVCAKSAWRHFHAFWKAHRGYVTDETIEDSMMALLFNIMAYMHRMLEEK